MQYYDEKAVGKRIQQLRKSWNMTQCVMAEKLDYTTERQLQRIDGGETACSVDKLMEIAQILGVSTDFLLFGVMPGKKNKFYKCLEGKSAEQIRYLEMILQVAAENLEMLR